MARNRVTIDAPPSAVYDVLTDADAYAQWVVGSKEVRAVDSSWPEKGARFHHTLGAGPARLEDSSQIVGKVPDRRLELEVRFRPLGVGRVVLDLHGTARGRRTKVIMTEYPTRGPARRLWARPLEPVLHLRNSVSLHRLRRIVEQRTAA